MDASLIQLYQKGIISKDDAIIHSNNSELMAKKIERL
jgi:Tfp pilus assembly ATPase PilU